MSDAVDKVEKFKQWYKNKLLPKGRLIQYCGRERAGAFDFPVEEAEREIEGLLAEAFYVDWSERQNQLYLKVWEFGGPEPSWENVYAEVKLL
jgi:hypothetical protein